ncbi:hypothetical protein GBF38_005649 [Nibea albiflora]|uniref:Uncharacterized protein n=1 Tax=Nibea albiflora TaxID=240163 RepID=A0ACB7EX73_NIBAL|nr:hypothetical protein GBF38_005649 [Nibea albiflora]
MMSKPRGLLSCDAPQFFSVMMGDSDATLDFTQVPVGVVTVIPEESQQPGPNALHLEPSSIGIILEGSDILDKAIQIEFIETTDFLRRPQSHSCGYVLKLPIGYYNYPDFRSEFNSILTSSMWVMDVV